MNGASSMRTRATNENKVASYFCLIFSMFQVIKFGCVATVVEIHQNFISNS